MWYTVQIDVTSSTADRVIDVSTQVGIAVAVEITLGKHGEQNFGIFLSTEKHCICIFRSIETTNTFIIFFDSINTVRVDLNYSIGY